SGFTRSIGIRRLSTLPRPVPRRSENRVTVSEYTGWPSSSTKRCSRPTSRSMKPTPSAPKYASQGPQPRRGRSPPTNSGPMMNSATRAAEIQKSVTRALKPSPCRGPRRSVPRRVADVVEVEGPVVGCSLDIEWVVGEKPRAVLGEDQGAVVVDARALPVSLRLGDLRFGGSRGVQSGDAQVVRGPGQPAHLRVGE